MKIFYSTKIEDKNKAIVKNIYFPVVKVDAELHKLVVQLVVSVEAKLSDPVEATGVHVVAHDFVMVMMPKAPTLVFYLRKLV